MRILQRLAVRRSEEQTNNTYEIAKNQKEKKRTRMNPTKYKKNKFTLMYNLN